MQYKLQDPLNQAFHKRIFLTSILCDFYHQASLWNLALREAESRVERRIVWSPLRGAVTEHQCSYKALLCAALQPFLFVKYKDQIHLPNNVLIVSEGTRQPQWRGRWEAAWMLLVTKAVVVLLLLHFSPQKNYPRASTGAFWQRLQAAATTADSALASREGAELSGGASSGRREPLLGQKGGIRWLPRQQTSAQPACSARAASSARGAPPCSPGQVSWECPSSPPTEQSLPLSNRCSPHSSKSKYPLAAAQSPEAGALWLGDPARKCRHQHERLDSSPGRSSPRGAAAPPGASARSCSLFPLATLCSKPETARIL